MNIFKIKNYKIVITSICLLGISCGVILGVLYFPKTNIVKSTIDDEFVFIQNKSEFSSSEIKTQIDKSVNNKIVEKYWTDPLSPLQGRYTVIFNMYEINNQNRFRFEQLEVSRKSILDFNWEIDKIYAGYILDKTFDQAVSLASKYDLSKENPDPANITVFEPLQPSTNPSSTPNTNPEVIVPNSQGVSTK